jgi:hypothetical protein
VKGKVAKMTLIFGTNPTLMTTEELAALNLVPVFVSSICEVLLVRKGRHSGKGDHVPKARPHVICSRDTAAIISINFRQM